MIDDEFTESIIGCAFKVYNTLGSGFLENMYKKELLIELKSAGLAAEEESPITVTYKEHNVGTFYADIVVDKRVILELKAVDSIAKVHEIQVVNYLKATGIPIGLLLNFGSSSLQIKRKYRDPANHGNPVILS